MAANQPGEARASGSHSRVLPPIIPSVAAGLHFAQPAQSTGRFAALAFGLIVYGVVLKAAITSGAWFGRDRTITARVSHDDEHTQPLPP